ncbi:hypothetical protein EBR43_05160 [bacterium]|jgi:hypothetical protein|nr:hypothetical protein [bacterium]NBX71740.1 hypothetical protein [bacterium]
MSEHNIKDFSNQALLLYKTIEQEIKADNQRDVLALLILKLKSVYEQGFDAGRYYEQYGYLPSNE